MTTLGKILVFANLVFSLVTGALIIMVFTTRTNWQRGHKEVSDRLKVSEANVRAMVDESKQIKAKGDAEITRLRNEITKLDSDKKKAEADVAAKDAALKAEIAKSNQVNTNVEAATRELIQRREEVKQFQAAAAGFQDKMNAQELRYKDVLDKYVRVDIAARSLQDRLKRMMEQNDGLAKEVERMRTGASLTAETKPPEDVKGVILDTDQKSNLVTLSIGSDAGLANGQTLEVYRLAPEPRYLGKVKILDVRPHQAVARPVALSRTAMIQKGDTVASNIMERP